MERGLLSGNVSITLLLLLLLNATTSFGFGTSHPRGSAILREPQPSGRTVDSISAEDGAAASGAVMEQRRIENVAASVSGADVTVEDDDNGSAGDAEETYGESNGNVRTTR